MRYVVVDNDGNDGTGQVKEFPDKISIEQCSLDEFAPGTIAPAFATLSAAYKALKSARSPDDYILFNSGTVGDITLGNEIMNLEDVTFQLNPQAIAATGNNAAYSIYIRAGQLSDVKRATFNNALLSHGPINFDECVFTYCGIGPQPPQTGPLESSIINNVTMNGCVIAIDNLIQRLPSAYRKVGKLKETVSLPILYQVTGKFSGSLPSVESTVAQNLIVFDLSNNYEVTFENDSATIIHPGSITYFNAAHPRPEAITIASTTITFDSICTFLEMGTVTTDNYLTISNSTLTGTDQITIATDNNYTLMRVTLNGGIVPSIDENQAYLPTLNVIVGTVTKSSAAQYILGVDIDSTCTLSPDMGSLFYIKPAGDLTITLPTDDQLEGWDLQLKRTGTRKHTVKLLGPIQSDCSIVLAPGDSLHLNYHNGIYYKL